MSMPFDFLGVVTVGPSIVDLKTMAERVRNALALEGGRNFKIAGGRITFDGLTGYLSFRKLVNIQSGEIDIRCTPMSIEFAYSIQIERRPLYFFSAVLAFGIALAAAGAEPKHFSVPLAFGGLGLIGSFVYAFMIRHRTHRCCTRSDATRRQPDPKSRYPAPRRDWATSA